MNLVVTLLIIGLIAAVLGFGGIAGASFAMAKVIFFIILVLFLLSIIFGAVGYRRLCGIAIRRPAPSGTGKCACAAFNVASLLRMSSGNGATFLALMST
jgi:uncharacterized membrane protein YtjA (UPF0391 family)